MLRPLRSAIERLQLWRWRYHHHDNLTLRRMFRERHRVDVGLYSYGCFDWRRMPGPIRVGRWCSIASSVRTVPINHPFEAMTTHPALYERRFGIVGEDIDQGETLVIEDDVWIGHNAIILPGCKLIGRGSIVGAGAIVTRDVDRYAIVAGNPARKLKDRFAPEVQAALEASRWWEMDMAELGELVRTRPELIYRPTAESIAAWAGGRPARHPA